LRQLFTVAVGVPVLATTLGQSVVTMSGLSVPVLAPEASAAIGIDPRYVGIFSAVVYALATITSPIAGGLVARYGGVRVVQASVVSAALGLVLFALGHPAAVLLAAFAIGCGVGPVTPASSHILARQTPPALQPLAFSIKQTGVPNGGMLAGLVAPPLVLAFGWRGAAIALAAICLLAALSLEPLRAWLDADRRADGRRARMQIRAPLALILANRPLRRLALASFVFSATQLSVSAFLVVYFTERLGLTLTAAGIAYAFAQGGGIVGRIAWGTLAEQVIPSRYLVVLLGFATTASLACLALLGDALTFPMLLALASVLGATAIGWTGLYLAEVARLAPPGRAAEATGGAMFMTFAGVVFGPPLVTLIVGVTGSYPVAFLTLGATVAAAALWLLVGLLRERAA